MASRISPSMSVPSSSLSNVFERTDNFIEDVIERIRNFAGVAVSRLAGGILGTNDRYTGLEKKDDDFGIVESEGWLVMHPANKVGELDLFNTGEIEAYGNEVIKNLCKVPITSSTKPSIEARLIEMSEQSNVLRKLLIRRLDELQGDKEAILEMKGNIIMTRG